MRVYIQIICGRCYTYRQKEDPRKIDANDDDMEGGRVESGKKRKCKLKSNP
jgi:hypothetical protein